MVKLLGSFEQEFLRPNMYGNVVHCDCSPAPHFQLILRAAGLPDGPLERFDGGAALGRQCAQETVLSSLRLLQVRT
jgi:hypothetical protein